MTPELRRVAPTTPCSSRPRALRSNLSSPAAVYRLSDQTVFDDAAKDKLWGDADRDWFFANLDGTSTTKDVVKDGQSNETQTDID